MNFTSHSRRLLTLNSRLFCRITIGFFDCLEITASRRRLLENSEQKSYLKIGASVTSHLARFSPTKSCYVNQSIVIFVIRMSGSIISVNAGSQFTYEPFESWHNWQASQAISVQTGLYRWAIDAIDLTFVAEVRIVIKLDASQLSLIGCVNSGWAARRAPGSDQLTLSFRENFPRKLGIEFAWQPRISIWRDFYKILLRYKWW